MSLKKATKQFIDEPFFSHSFPGWKIRAYRAVLRELPFAAFYLIWERLYKSFPAKAERL
jgi:hypothetical protein